MGMSVGALAFSEDEPTNGHQTTVTHTEKQTWTITIPDNVELGTKNQNIEKELKIENLMIPNGKALDIQVASAKGFKVVSEENAELTYKVAVDSKEISTGTEATSLYKATSNETKTLTFTLTGSAESSGNYTDTLTFSAEITEAGE